MRWCVMPMRIQKMEKMKKNKTLFELLIGIIFCGLVIQIILLPAFKDYLYNAIGLWSGIAVACGVAIHLQRSIEDALDLGEEGAVKHVRTAYATRMIVATIVMGTVLFFDWGNPITLLIGVFPLKISAYLQPSMDKLFQKFK